MRIKTVGDAAKVRHSTQRLYTHLAFAILAVVLGTLIAIRFGGVWLCNEHSFVIHEMRCDVYAYDAISGLSGRAGRAHTSQGHSAWARSEQTRILLNLAACVLAGIT